MLISCGMYFFEIVFSFPSNFHDMFIEIKCNYSRFPFCANQQFLCGVLYTVLLVSRWLFKRVKYQKLSHDWISGFCVLNTMDNSFKITARMFILNFWLPRSYLKKMKKYYKIILNISLSNLFNGIYSENGNPSCHVNFLNSEISTVFALRL